MGQRLQSLISHFPSSVKSPLSFHIDLSWIQVYGKPMALCRRTIYAPDCYLGCVNTRLIFKENSWKPNLVLCGGSWLWGERVSGNHYRKTNWGMATAFVLRDSGGGKAKDVGKKWKKRGKERKACSWTWTCVHTYTASFVWLWLPVGTCSKWKMPPQRDLTASLCQTIVSWLSETVTCSQAKPKD